MNPELLALLSRYGMKAARMGMGAFQGRNLLEEATFSGGDLGPAIAGFDMPEAAMERMEKAQAARAPSPHHRIMNAFDDMKAARGDSLNTPQHAIEKDFNDVSMVPPSAGMPWWMQGAQAQAPVAAQGPEQQAPQQQLPLPPDQRPVHDMLSAQVPHTPFNPAPVAPPELSWFQRNGMMQRDPETGAYLDPQMAQRAQSAGGLFG